MTVREMLGQALEQAVRKLGVEGDLPDLELGRAKIAAHGDYASSAGLKLARTLKAAPPDIAGRLASMVSVPDGAATAEAAGGYVNFRLTDDWLRRLVTRVATGGPGYGRNDAGKSEQVQVEFVSTNPTGPLHIGHGRGAILGDSLARLLEFSGYAVEREYYVNDYGTQALKFAQSIWARMHGQEPPAGGYVGDYVNDIAIAARAAKPGVENLPEQEALDFLMAFGSDLMIDQFKKTLAHLDVRYDRWQSERALWESKAPLALERLKEGGYLRQRDGATWFGPAMDEDDGLGEHVAGDEEDRVVIRSDGRHTYFASDLGYMLDRLESRGISRVIEVWGADHHGYVARIKAGAAALGLDPERIVVILNQMVSLVEGRMSRRQGRFVTLDELVLRAGKDAVRYFYLMYTPDAMMEFNLERALIHGNENPVYYAQYAHARLTNVESVATEKHQTLPEAADMALLVHPWEFEVARQIAFWPEVVAEATRLFEPHRITYYIHDLATAVHRFYHAGNDEGEHRIVVDDARLTRARLELCRAARHTLKTALDLVGVSAPERM